MPEQDYEDRRVFERFPVDFPVRLLGVDSDIQAEGRAFDMCAKGIGLFVSRPLNQDTDLEIWLDIPDKAGSLYARGKVVWIKEVLGNEYKAGINLEKADFMGVSRALRTVL